MIPPIAQKLTKVAASWPQLHPTCSLAHSAAGGFAYVFLVTDAASGRELVLKRMRLAADNDEGLALAR
jgi:hypothetical protein